MKRISLIHTYTGKRRHPTLLLRLPGATVFAWVHGPERPWRFIEGGVYCLGLVFLSFNIYSSKAFE